MAGGYKIVDLRDINVEVGAEAVTIPGIYNEIESNYRKPVQLTGIMVGGLEKPSVFVSMYHSGNAYYTKLILDESGEITLEISSEDFVKMTR